ncbi:sorbin/SH3 domain protein [Thalictrum thalictroides]|uniref:Sorbin/SH3 domain protein n=1 Tax=Thalictrum thalictroides TaxID=46969 RepID=A0A7J6V9M2_THATH|nr:sorbin/SH3 domain protein [Thalictrum thalictroides]
MLWLQKTAPWMSVPQFGDWDQKGGVPDYSMDFSKIREMRKQNKRDPSRASLGNEEEFISQPNSNDQLHPHPHQDDHHLRHKEDSPIARKSFLSYFNCCVKA